MKTGKILFLCLMMPWQLVCYSQNDTLNAVRLSELSFDELLNMEVFTASKKFQKISEAPAIISVVTRQDIEKMGVTSLIDVFKYIPGIETSMGPDGQYRLSIRGSRKEGNILMLIDGKQINDFYNGKLLFDLPLDFIDKIEIVRGPGSALYGSNAVAGVINIFTIKSKKITVKGGTNNTFSGSAHYYLNKEKFQMNASGGYLQSDGANAQIESDGANNRPWSLTYGDLNYKTQRWLKDAYVNTGFKTGGLKFDLFGISRQQGSWAGPLYIAAPGSNLKTKQLTSALSFDLPVKDIVVIVPKIYTNVVNRDFLNQEAPDNYASSVSGDVFSNGKETHEKYTGVTYGTELAFHIKITDRCSLLTGNLLENASLPQYSVERNYKIVGDEYKGSFGNYDSVPTAQKNKQRTIIAYFLQADYKWKRLSFTGGFRYDNYSDFGSSFNPRFSITYNASKLIRFKGLYGKAFRAPTFQELYDNTSIGNEYGVIGNPALKPETIQTFEVGTEFSYKKLILRYNIFYNLNNNLIRVYDPHGAGAIGSYQNIGNLLTYGNEAEATLVVNSRLNVFANYSQFVSEFEWNTGNIRKADINYLAAQNSCGKMMKNIPVVRANAGVSYGISKFHLFAGINYGSAAQNNTRYYLEEARYVTIPMWIQCNFGVTYAPNDKLRIRLSANNIGKKYSDPEESLNIDNFGQKGLIQPSATFLLSLTYKFLK
jgi:iron complex outermembrane receptor protein